VNLEKGTHIFIVPMFDRKKVSNRTRNKLHEHGGHGFIVLAEPSVPTFDTKGVQWIRVRSLEKNVSLAKWGQSEKEAWEGWLPLDEIKIKYPDAI